MLKGFVYIGYINTIWKMYVNGPSRGVWNVSFFFFFLLIVVSGLTELSKDIQTKHMFMLKDISFLAVEL